MGRRGYPRNYQAVLAEAINSTLLKSMEMYPSDPISANQAAPVDTPWQPGWGLSAEYDAPSALEAGELGGEAGGLAERGEAAAVAL